MDAEGGSQTVDNKIALEEHLSTEENNKLSPTACESSRNGKVYTEYVKSHLLDVDERLKIMDATGIERTIVSLTSPGIQSITDAALARRVAMRDRSGPSTRASVSARAAWSLTSGRK